MVRQVTRGVRPRPLTAPRPRHTRKKAEPKLRMDRGTGRVVRRTLLVGFFGVTLATSPTWFFTSGWVGWTTLAVGGWATADTIGRIGWMLRGDQDRPHSGGAAANHRYRNPYDRTSFRRSTRGGQRYTKGRDGKFTGSQSTGRRRR